MVSAIPRDYRGQKTLGLITIEACWGVIENSCRLTSFVDEKSSVLLAGSWRVVSMYVWGDWDNRNRKKLGMAIAITSTVAMTETYSPSKHAPVKTGKHPLVAIGGLALHHTISEDSAYLTSLIILPNIRICCLS